MWPLFLKNMNNPKAELISQSSMLARSTQTLVELARPSKDRLEFSKTYGVLHAHDSGIAFSVFLDEQVAEDTKHDNPKEACLLVNKAP